MVKTYVLDTNILMSTEGRAIYGFEDNTVIVTHTTQEELDHFKEKGGEKGYQAREVIRIINDIVDNKQDNENLLKGIKMANGGTFRLTTNFLNATLPRGWDLDSADNRILCTTKTLATQGGAEGEVILITNDINMKLKAIALELKVQQYQNDQIQTTEFYSGRAEIIVPDNMVDKLCKDKKLGIKDIIKRVKAFENEANLQTIENLVANQFVVVKGATGGSALAWRKGDILKYIQDDEKPTYGIKAKNAGQNFALEALKASVDEIPLVILKGPAGCGKTLLAMAVGLEKTYTTQTRHKSDGSNTFNSIVITRSNTLADEEMGFLPGDLEDKMSPLLAPFFDNLKVLLGSKEEDIKQINIQIADMFEDEVIEITSLAYIRGRSLTKTYLIVDEAQNLTRIQAKTIATRIGEGSKIILLGDPDQIDNPKVDKKSNGLTYLSDSFKGSELCAQVQFTDNECVRSKFAKEAISLLA